jgi:large subunit ribosomal protein L18
MARRKRVRKKVKGDQQRPRLSVYISNRHIYAQVIDDLNGATLVAASSLSPEIKKEGKQACNLDDEARASGLKF